MRFLSDKRIYVWLGFVILLGLALRLYNITKTDFWYDEAYTGILIKRPWNEFYKYILLDTHPPLYYGALKLWVTLVGYSDFTIRLFSTIFSVLLIPLSFIFIKTLGIKRRSLLYIVPLVFAVNPFFIAYSSEARSYSIIGFFTLLLVIFYLKAVKKSVFEVNKYWIIYSLVVTFAIFIHYEAIFSILALNIYYAYLLIKALKAKPLYGHTDFLSNLYESAKVLLVSYALPIISFALWYPSFRLQTLNTKSVSWVPIPEIYLLPKSLYSFLFGVSSNNLGVPPANNALQFTSPESLGFLLYTMLIVLFVVVYKKLEQNEKEINIILLTSWLIPIILHIFLSYLKINLYVERYFIGYSIFFIINILLLLSKLKFRYFTALLWMYLSVATFYSTKTLQPEGYKSLKAYIENSKDTNFIFVDPFEYIIASYYVNDVARNRLYIADIDPKWNLKSWELINEDKIIQEQKLKIDNTNILVTSANTEYIRQEGKTNFTLAKLKDDYNQIGIFKIFANKNYNLVKK